MTGLSMVSCNRAPRRADARDKSSAAMREFRKLQDECRQAMTRLEALSFSDPAHGQADAAFSRAETRLREMGDRILMRPARNGRDLGEIAQVALLASRAPDAAIDAMPELLENGGGGGDRFDTAAAHLIRAVLELYGDLQDDLSAIVRDREVMNVPDAVGPRAIVLRVDDSGMTDDGIPEGSLVICDPDQPCGAGDYVFAISFAMKRAVLRRLRALSPDNRKCELVAENRFLSPIALASPKDGFIVGRAMGLWKKL